MPEIALPTAAKQDEILKRISDNPVLNNDSNIHLNVVSDVKATGASSSDFQTVLQINGKGLLFESFLSFNRSQSLYYKMRITVDGTIVFDESVYETKGDVGIATAPYYRELVQGNSANVFHFSSFTGKRLTGGEVGYKPLKILKYPISFNNSLKIEVLTEYAATYINAYKLL